MVHSLNKGKRGEREVAKLLQDFGVEARRGRQFSGSPDSPDVISSLDNLHIEVKLRERFELYPSLEQAERDDPDRIPIVFHRRKRKDWTITMYAQDFLKLYLEKDNEEAMEVQQVHE